MVIRKGGDVCGYECVPVFGVATDDGLSLATGNQFDAGDPERVDYWGHLITDHRFIGGEYDISSPAPFRFDYHASSICKQDIIVHAFSEIIAPQ